jgi:hypothetical protein
MTDLPATIRRMDVATLVFSAIAGGAVMAAVVASGRLLRLIER